MNQRWQTMLAALVLLLLPTLALGQEDDRERTPGKRPNLRPKGTSRPDSPGAAGGAMMQMLPLMAALDTDQDGTLSAAEIANASKSLLKLDTDGDGVLSAEELRPDLSKMPGGGLPGGLAGVMQGGLGQLGPAAMSKMFDSRDKNGDGKLSGDEIPERLRERVSMLDKDGDGAISKSEMEGAASRLNELGGKRPKKGGNDTNDGGGVKPKRPPQ